MKKPLHHLLAIAAVLSTSIASAQNPPVPSPRPPTPEAPPRDARPPREDPYRLPQQQFDQSRRDDLRWPEGDRPPRPEGEGQPEDRDFQGEYPNAFMFRDRFKNAPPVPQKPQPYVGVVTRPLEPALSAQLGITPGLGLIVEDIIPDGPAAKAGVQSLDVIKQLNDQLVSSPSHLAALVRHFGKDTEVTLLVVRKGQEQKIAIKIGERLMPEPTPFRADMFGGMRPPGAGSEEFGRRVESLRRGGSGEGLFRGARKSQNVPDAPPLRPSEDILREVAPGGPPQVKSFQNQSSTTWNTASARVTLKDANGEIEVHSDNGKRTLTAKNPKGESVFDGPIDTEEQRKSVPAEFRKMLDQVEVQSRADRRPGQPQQPGAGARASVGGFAPRPPEPDRPEPRQNEPEVQ